MNHDHATPGAAHPPPGSVPVVMGVPGLQAIIDALRGQGFTVIGPTRQDGVRSCDLHAIGIHDKILLGLPPDELTRQCEQAIRNYDPCISCATHFLDLTVEHR